MCWLGNETSRTFGTVGVSPRLRAKCLQSAGCLYRFEARGKKVAAAKSVRGVSGVG